MIDCQPVQVADNSEVLCRCCRNWEICLKRRCRFSRVTRLANLDEHLVAVVDAALDRADADRRAVALMSSRTRLGPIRSYPDAPSERVVAIFLLDAAFKLLIYLDF